MDKRFDEQQILHKQLIKYANDISRLYQELKEENALLEKAYKELEENYYETVLMGFELINLNDEFLGSHCKRVAYHSDKLAKALGLKEKRILNVKLAALLHDIGLIGVPKEDILVMFAGTNQVLQKIYRQHPIVKVRPITSSKRFEGIARIIVAHHENLDGSGFPSGLKEDEIPYESKIIAVVNGYDEIKILQTRKLKPEAVLVKMEKDVGIKYDLNMFNKFSELILGGDPFAETIHVGVYELEPGMILAKPIMTANEKIKILSSDTVLREDHIEHLKRYFEYANLKLPITVYKPE